MNAWNDLLLCAFAWNPPFSHHIPIMPHQAQGPKIELRKPVFKKKSSFHTIFTHYATPRDYNWTKEARPYAKNRTIPTIWNSAWIAMGKIKNTSGHKEKQENISVVILMSNDFQRSQYVSRTTTATSELCILALNHVFISFSFHSRSWFCEESSSHSDRSNRILDALWSCL